MTGAGTPWVSVLMQVSVWALTAVLAWLVGRVTSTAKTDKQEREALYSGVRALLRDKLTQAHTLYVDKGASMSLYEKENLIAIHDAYNALGGNDIGDDQYRQIMAK